MARGENKVTAEILALREKMESGLPLELIAQEHSRSVQRLREYRAVWRRKGILKKGFPGNRGEVN